MRGGTGMSALPSFSWPGTNAVIPPNMYQVDPVRSGYVGSERLMGDPNGNYQSQVHVKISGGKKKRRSMKRPRRMRRMRGGDGFLPHDPVTSFATAEGASFSGQVIAGNVAPSINSFDQPIENPLNNYTTRILA